MSASRERDRGAAHRLEVSSGAGRRSLILRAAASSFADLGYGGTSLEDICRGAGIAKPSLYHYFPSKAAILFQVLSDYLELMIGLGDAPERLRLAPAEQLLEAMKDMIASLDTHRGEVRCFNDGDVALLADDMHDHIMARRGYYSGQVDRILLAGRKDGSFAFEYVNVTRLSIFGMCGWAYNWYSPEGSVAAEEVAERMCRLLIAGIRGPAA